MSSGSSREEEALRILIGFGSSREEEALRILIGFGYFQSLRHHIHSFFVTQVTSMHELSCQSQRAKHTLSLIHI